MKTQYQNILKTSVVSAVAALMLSSSAWGDCTYELFNIGSAKGTKIADFIDQLSDECEFSVVVTDSDAEKTLNSALNKTHIKNLTLNEVLDLILLHNNLNYTFENNTLKISYLTTKVFNIDYILSQRKGVGSTNVTLSSASNTSTGATGSSTSSSSSSGTSGTSPSTANSGIKIDSSDEVIFWSELDKELGNILNRPEDKYTAKEPIINKNAGLITVTATKTQIDRLDKYLAKLQEKVKLQVLIDVQLLTVTMNKSKTTGIDWAQLYKLQNVNVGLNYTTNNLQTGSGAVTLTGASINLDQVVKFLKTQGDVSSISNPKVLTLNNQPALVTAGTEYFYTIKQSTSTTGTATTTAENDTISSVFAGVLLDITPEISDNDMITLKINPSLSETTTDMSNTTSAGRKTPPDLNRRQLSSVVTVKDGNKIVLGGLIHTSNSKSGNKIPLLGDIPGLSYLFGREDTSKQIEELVMIIQPHIIKKDNVSPSLSDLGYETINDKVLKKENEKKKVGDDE
jgi:general secretion pathway protein D